MNVFFHVGRYFQMMVAAFHKPEKARIYRKAFYRETVNLGVNSISLVAIISVFMGAVITLQTASMIDSPLLPVYTVGYTTRQSTILEFAPTIISLILAGKVGSNIASEIGTMRVTEQIDALEIMGVNSRGFLVTPKILACMFLNPFIIVMSIFLSIFGGWLVSILTGILSTHDYFYGIRFDFDQFTVTYALIKTVVFAFIITSVSAYQGYYVEGGALDVGKASTRSVKVVSILILVFNYILTNLLLI